MRTTPPTLRRIAASKKARRREKQMKAARDVIREQVQTLDKLFWNDPARPDEKFTGLASRYANVSRDESRERKE